MISPIILAAVITIIPTAAHLVYTIYTYDKIPRTIKRIIGCLHRIKPMQISALIRQFSIQIHLGDVDVFPLRIVKLNYALLNHVRMQTIDYPLAFPLILI